MLNRRQLLAATGLGGASLFLPSLAPRARAQQMPPKRLVIFYTGQGTVYDTWRMRRPGQTETADFEFPFDDPDPMSFSEILRPLHGVRDDLLVLDGMAMATALVDQPINNHPKGRIHSLTGAPIARVADNASTSSAPSIDQIIAARIRRPDRLSSLELYGDGNEPMLFSGPGAALPFENNPQTVFDRIFPASQMQAPQSNTERIAAAQSSVLDFVRGEYDNVKPRLGSEDKRKLDLHRDLIRDLEMRLGALSSIVCNRPARPGRVPPSDYQLHVDTFSPIIAAALSCDITRVVTMMMPLLPNAMCGAPPGDIHNDFAHHTNDNPMAAQIMTNFHAVYATQLRGIIDLLKAIPEGNGTLLDNTLVLWMNELATGNHRFTKYPVVIAGKAGGALRTGRYIRWAPHSPTPDPHPEYMGVDPLIGPGHNRLLVSVCQAMGLTDIDEIGSTSVTTTSGTRIDVTGPLDRLA